METPMTNIDQLVQELEGKFYDVPAYDIRQILNYLHSHGHLQNEWQPMDVMEFQADREVDRLVAEFGGVEQWQEVSRQLLEYGRRNLPPSVLEEMTCSFEGVMALYHLMKGEAYGEQK